MGQQNIEQALIQNLEDAGCTLEIIELFMRKHDDSNMSEQIKILTTHRSQVLEQVRSGQKKLDCLDYLLCKLKKRTIEKKENI